jgi:hypothetical protein
MEKVVEKYKVFTKNRPAENESQQSTNFSKEFRWPSDEVFLERTVLL